MKKSLLPFLCFIAIVFSQLEVDAQAKRYVFYEHFTQASCPPCAPFNATFEPYFNKNITNLHHIAFHTWWPGVDEMFDYNDPENTAHINYHGVTAAPNMVANGLNIGSTVGPAVNPNLDRLLGLGTSPIRIQVVEERVGDKIEGTMTIQVLGSLPTGNYVYRLAALEREVKYASPPGSNGEDEFPNVFRKFVTRSGQAGESVVLNPGQDVIVDFSYDIDMDVWDPTEVFTMAWVSNEGTREVINSGRATDDIEVVNTEPNRLQEGGSGSNSFTAEIYNKSTEDKQITIDFSSSQPGNWNSSYTFQGSDYNGKETFTISPGAHPLVINGTAGSSAGVGSYLAEVQGPRNGDQDVKDFLVKDVVDLVVYRDYGNFDISEIGVNNLASAGSDAYGAIPDEFLAGALSSGALSTVDNMFYNVGLNYPAMEEDAATELMKFMDAGGNLLLSGQDVAWDMVSGEAGSAGSVPLQLLYAGYLHGEYRPEIAANAITAIGDDEVFKNAGGSPFRRVYGSGNLNPDVLAPADDAAFPILEYETGDIAGLRVHTPTHKAVVLGFGLEDLALNNARNNIVAISRDWFNGQFTNTEFEQAMAALQMGQSFPNPANEEVIIPFNGNWDNDMFVRVVNLNGEIMATSQLTPGAQTLKINTSKFANGVYFYQLTDGVEIGAPQKIVVMH